MCLCKGCDDIDIYKLGFCKWCYTVKQVVSVQNKQCIFCKKRLKAFQKKDWDSRISHKGCWLDWKRGYIYQVEQ
jgi:hypothetical protein